MRSKADPESTQRPAISKAEGVVPDKSLDDLDAVLAQDATSHIYVDFDYTLLNSSSTEEFLNLGRPSIVAAVLLRLLRVLKPWSLGPKTVSGYIWRDPIRTWAMIITLPWTLWRFRRKAPAIFERLSNKTLVEHLESVDPSRITIVSVGFERFIRQLLRGSALENTEIIASSLMRPLAIRRCGKLEWLESIGRPPSRDEDIVISDSHDDADLLGCVDRAYMIEPDLTDTRWMLRDVYVPFFYTARVKRSIEFVVKQILLEELVVILLATALFQPFSLGTWIGAALLFVGFFVVYEIGYSENDRIGHITELMPKVSPNYEKLKNVALQPAAWYWAISLTIVGTLILGADISVATMSRLGMGTGHAPAVSMIAVVLIWLAIILLGRVVFYVYNRLPMTWRVFAYLPLHFVKYFGLVVILPTQAVGYALLCSQLIRTWSLYAIRRCGGDIEVMASQLVRLVFFLMILFVLKMAAPSSEPFNDWHTWVILAWCVVRSIPEAKRKLFSKDGLRSGLRGSSAASDTQDGGAESRVQTP